MNSQKSDHSTTIVVGLRASTPTGRALPPRGCEERARTSHPKSPTKLRKATTATRQGKTQGRWTQEEHERFLEAIRLYDKDWKKVTQHVGTRISAQVRSHAQKVLPDYSIAARQANTGSQAAQSISSKKSDKDTHSNNQSALVPPHEEDSSSLLGKRLLHQREDSQISSSYQLPAKRQRADSTEHLNPSGYQIVQPAPTSSLVAQSIQRMNPGSTSLLRGIASSDHSSQHSVAESPCRSAPGETKRGLKLQQQESVATIMQPLNTNLNNGQHYATFMQQLSGAVDPQKLTQRLDHLIEKRKQMLNTLYSTGASTTAFESKISELQNDTASLLLDCKQVVAQARQIQNPDVKTRILQRALTLNLDVKSVRSTLQELLEMDELFLPSAKDSAGVRTHHLSQFLGQSGIVVQPATQSAGFIRNANANNINTQAQPASQRKVLPSSSASQSSNGGEILRPQAIRALPHDEHPTQGSAAPHQQIHHPHHHHNENSLGQILQQLLSADIPGSGCSTGSTHGYHHQLGVGMAGAHLGHSTRFVTPQASSHRNSFNSTTK